jgi:Tfp pilus assembly protein PilO
MALKSREKILIFLAIIAVAVWIFDSFYYAPKGRQIKILKTEIKAADQKLNESLQMTKGVETLEAEVLRQEEDLKRLSECTLKGEEFRAFLKHLARESTPLQMKVISIVPQEEKLPPPEEKKEASSKYRKVLVQMIFHSTYPKLGTYLKGIEELPFLINIENLQIERIEDIHPLLKVSMGLNIYITGELEGVGGRKF